MSKYKSFFKIKINFNFKDQIKLKIKDVKKAFCPHQELKIMS
jgi:hypothetical protein